MRHVSFMAWIAILAMMLSACGGGTTITEDGFTEIGKEATSGDIVITMDEGQIANYQVRATFTIENKGASEFAIDPATTLVIKGSSEGTDVKLELDKRTCGSKLIQGPVPAGGKVTGDVCWRGNATDTWPAEALIGFNGQPGAEGVVTWKLVVE